MKMSNELYNDLKNEVIILSEKHDLKTLRNKTMAAGNSEIRFAFDLFWMVQGYKKYGQRIEAEDLHDGHIQTAMLKIVREVIVNEQDK